MRVFFTVPWGYRVPEADGKYGFPALPRKNDFVCTKSRATTADVELRVQRVSFNSEFTEVKIVLVEED